MRPAAILLAAFIASIPFWLGVNLMAERVEEFVFLRQLAADPQVKAAYAAQAELESMVRTERPTRKAGVKDPAVRAVSALSLHLDGEGTANTLFSQNASERVPVASLTKLMTALVVLRHYPLNDVVVVSRSAVAEEEDFGDLEAGQELYVRDLLYPLLMESSNDAASSLAEVVGRDAFLELMNLEAERLGLNSTAFFNPSGLDPDPGERGPNLSTAQDLGLLTSHLLRSFPQVFDILTLSSFDLYAPDGTFHHTLKNTNLLLTENGWPTKVLGGKTGWTPLAQGALILVLESPKQQGKLVFVVLGARDRFGEMRKLVDWTLTSHQW